jgi:hypothetical protein
VLLRLDIRLKTYHFGFDPIEQLIQQFLDWNLFQICHLAIMAEELKHRQAYVKLGKEEIDFGKSSHGPKRIRGMMLISDARDRSH